MEAYKTKVLLSIKFREVRGNCTGKTNRYIPECSIVYMFFYFAVSVYLYIYIYLCVNIFHLNWAYYVSQSFVFCWGQ